MSGKESPNQTVRPFAGLTRYSEEPHLPAEAFGHSSSMRWWAEERGSDDVDGIPIPDTSMNSLIDTLPSATTAEVAWKHPMTGEWIQTEKHNAVVEPSRVDKVSTINDPERGLLTFSTTDEAEAYLREQPAERLADLAQRFGTDDDATASTIASAMTVGDEALFYIPTDSYAIINPADFLRPMAEVLRDADLGDDVFGEARLYRAGGKVSMDVFFDGKHVDWPGQEPDRKPIVLGLQVDWDHFGGTSVHIQGTGMDWECVNSFRAITEKVTVKHSGDPNERVDWHRKFEQVLEEIDLKADQLAQVIQEASELELDLSEFPPDFGAEYERMDDVRNATLAALYDYAGLPQYLAKHAANNCVAEAADPYNPTWWEVHRGATYAISHHANSDTHSGSNIEAQNRIANDMMMNPAAVQENVVRRWEEGREDETLEDEGAGRAAILKATGDLADKKAEYEERQEVIARLTAD